MYWSNSLHLSMERKRILEVGNLSISSVKEEQLRPLIENVSFDLYSNEILAVVGESGSGKSITSLAILGLLPEKALKINQGSINFYGTDLINQSKRELSSIRGKEIGMIFQEPMSSLNPSMTCGKQVLEVLQTHYPKQSKSVNKAEVLELFNKVKLPNPKRLFNAYPHEISGGQKQRVMIAMAIACKPKILIADEPTTALDVTVQKEIIILLKELMGTEKMSIIFISHDLTLVSELADRVLVMYKGAIVEEGRSEDIFLNPKETYTKALIKARPSTKFRLKTLPTIEDFINGTISEEIISESDRRKIHNALYKRPPLLEIRDIKKTFMSKLGWFRKVGFNAVDGVSFKVYEGETLGLVGESGCGKSTLSNVILQLDEASSGQVLYQGKDICKLGKSEIRKLRKDIQIIFQDPFASLNPRIAVGQAIMEPMKVHGIGTSNNDRANTVKNLLVKVGLDEDCFYRYPHEFSGGQRQRIGIARTIALKPKLVICDESVSALDISVQAQVLNLLNDLKQDYGFTYIFISHDLAVVKYMSDQLLVMNKGKIEEMNDADIIYSNPQSEYTKKLIHAIPKGL